MLHRQGFTLIEILIVLIIIGIAAVFSMPNFNTPTEQARALNAQNNLLAIYSAEKNYLNNNSAFCVDQPPPNGQIACAESGNPNCAKDLASINCNLSLNIQDDGTYSYACAGSTCTATRTSVSLGLTITLTAPIQLNGSPKNPSCNLSSSWCP